VSFCSVGVVLNSVNVTLQLMNKFLNLDKWCFDRINDMVNLTDPLLLVSFRVLEPEEVTWFAKVSSPEVKVFILKDHGVKLLVI